LSTARKRGLTAKPISSSATTTRKSTNSLALNNPASVVANGRASWVSTLDSVAGLLMHILSCVVCGLRVAGATGRIERQELGGAAHNLLLRKLVALELAGHPALAHH